MIQLVGNTCGGRAAPKGARRHMDGNGLLGLDDWRIGQDTWSTAAPGQR